jgi:hypothetical protein
VDSEYLFANGGRTAIAFRRQYFAWSNDSRFCERFGFKFALNVIN